MSMRDKITDIISEAECGDDRGYGPWVLDPDVLADAILATIKASVPELVWEETKDGYRNPLGYAVRCDASSRNRYYVTGPNGVVIFGPEKAMHQLYPLTGKQAKAEAQAHHVAQRTGWMMKNG